MKKLIKGAFLWPVFCCLFVGLAADVLRAQEPTITISPSSSPIDLGCAQVGKISARQKIDVKVSPLGGFDHKYSVKFESTQSEDFYATAAYFDPATETATMYISLFPKSVGPKAGYVILQNDGQELRRILVLGLGVPEGSPEFDTGAYYGIEFGKIETGHSYEKSITVSTRNSGPEPTVALRGADAGEFTVSGTLKPNMENQTITIRTHPLTDGEKQAELILKDGSVYKVLPIKATVNYPKPYLGVGIESLVLPDAYIGESSSRELEVMMQNIWIQPTLSIEGPHKNLFSIEGALPTQANSGRIKIIFTPQKEKKVEATLRIVSGEAKVTLPLVAWGFEKATPEILVEPEEVNFGRVQIQSFVDKSVKVTVKHTSATPVVELGGPDKDIFSTTTKALDGQFQLNIAAIPNKAGKLTAWARLKVGEVEKQLPISMDCFAPNPVLQVNRTEINFEQVAVGTTSLERGVDVVMDQLSEDVSISIVGPDADQFKASKSSIERIAPRAFVGVICTPTSLGSKTATLLLSSEDMKVEVALKAQAITALEEVQKAESACIVDNRVPKQLTVLVAKPGARLTVYALDGTVLADTSMNRRELSLSLPAGPCVVRYDRTVVKTLIKH